MRLLQKEEVREEGAGAVAREGHAAEVTITRVVVRPWVLTEPAADSSIGGSSSQKLAASVGKRAADVDYTQRKSEMARQSKEGWLKIGCQKRKTMCLCRYKRRQWSRPLSF